MLRTVWNAGLVIRGLRAITDFEYELQMSQTNHKLDPEIETDVFDNQSGIFLSEFYYGKREWQLLGEIFHSLYRNRVARDT